jgi:23S rRNA (guanosine2251-2'-O)-methyltransferase
MSGGDWTVGFHAVESALRSGRPIETVWLQEGRRDGRMRALERLARSAGASIRRVSARELAEIAGGTPHNGCAARGAPVAWAPLEACIKPEGEAARLVLLDGVTDPHNLGAVVRSAAAFAVDGVIVAGPSVPPLGGAAAKAAAGHLERVPLVRATVAGDVLARLQGEGYWTLGAEAGGQDVAEIDPTHRWVLCLGAEAKGLRAKTRSRIDERVSIPMDPAVESLNLSVAAGVLMYGLVRFGGRPKKA